MKFSELRKHLEALAEALDGVGAQDSSRAVRTMSDGLKPFNKRDVADLELVTLAPSFDVGSRPQVREFQYVLLTFEGFFARAAKAPVKAAFNTLKTIVNDRQDMAIRSFIEALHQAFSPDRPVPSADETVVDAYVASLRAAKHDDQRFPQLYHQLSTDDRLSKDDIVEIASKFAFKMAKSTSKKTALERIWKMHNASETFAAKSRAMKGKSAA